MKTIKVDISEVLSSTQEIEVPDDFDEDDTKALEQIVKDTIMLPSDCLIDLGHYNWVVDDFCVI